MNEYEEAFERLINHLETLQKFYVLDGGYFFKNNYEHDKALIKHLVKKATPKKVKKSKPLEHDVTIGKAIFCKGITFLTKCPNCDAWLNPLYHKEYCGKCGQRVSLESEEND